MQFEYVQLQRIICELVAISNSLAHEGWLAGLSGPLKHPQLLSCSCQKRPTGWIMMDHESSSDVVWLTQVCVPSETCMLHIQKSNTFQQGIMIRIINLNQEIFTNAPSLQRCKSMFRRAGNKGAGKLFALQEICRSLRLVAGANVAWSMTTRAHERCKPTMYEGFNVSGSLSGVLVGVKMQ
jgi:hypothetical protein